MEHRRMHSSYGGSSVSGSTTNSSFSSRRRGASVTSGASGHGTPTTSISNIGGAGSTTGVGTSGTASTRRALSLLSSPATRNAGLSMSFPLPSSSSPAARPTTSSQSTNHNTNTSSIPAPTNSNPGERTVPIRRTRHIQQLSESRPAPPPTETKPDKPSHRKAANSLSISTSSTPRRIASTRNPPPAVPLKSPIAVAAVSRGQGVPLSSFSHSLTQHRRTTSTQSPATSKEDLRIELPQSPEPLSPGPISPGLLSPGALSPGPLSPTSLSFSSLNASGQKKSPARFSSNGIATASGPPPSLAFRNMDFARQKKPPPPVPSRRSSTINVGGAGKRPSVDRRESVTSNDDNDTMDSQRTIRAIDDVKRRRIEQEKEEQRELARRREEEMFADVHQDTEPEDNNDDTEKHENNDSGDVFFSLARSDTVHSRPDTTDNRAERRRTRMAQYAQRSSLPASTFSPSRSPSRQPEPEPVDPISWRHSTHASPTPSERQRRQRAESMGNSSEEVSPKMLRKQVSRPRSIYGDSSPIANTSDLTRSMEAPLRNSSLLRNHESVSYSPVINDSPTAENPQRRSLQELVESDRKKPKIREHDGDDSVSTVSTTAPSTVWDELDDLKSRIRRLEITGRMPASHASATMSNSSGERPRTANTTMTTLSSSSPRHKGSSNGTGASPPRTRNLDAVTMTPATPLPASHPLLQTALAKSEPYLSPDAYKLLQAVGNDALTLAGHVGSTGTPGTVGSSPVPDRQLRRKVDSMCRSLTEFCIALTESNNTSTPNTPQAHNQLMALTLSRPSPREMLDSPRLRSETSLSSRKDSSALSNYGLRRGSTLSVTTRPSVAASDYGASPTTSLPPSRLARSSFLKRDTSLRAPSRAVTDFDHSEYSQPHSSSTTTITAAESLAIRRRERQAEREQKERERDREIRTLQSSPPRHSDDVTATRRVLDISGRGLVESRLRTGSLSQTQSSPAQPRERSSLGLTRTNTARRVISNRASRDEHWEE